MLEKWGHPDLNVFHLKFYLENGPNGLNWHCCLAGSSKTAARILIFSIAMGANYSFEVKNIKIWTPAFFKHNNSFVATVNSDMRMFMLTINSIS